MTFAYLGALGTGIKNRNRDELQFTCGCSYHAVMDVQSYAIVSCKQQPTHFQVEADRQALVEHRRSHKRRRKACRYCREAA